MIGKDSAHERQAEFAAPLCWSEIMQHGLQAPGVDCAVELLALGFSHA